jgi:ABC-2 type transport system ATP-binding protein
VETVVKIENLVKRYDELVALDHLNLNIASGEIFGLLGPNGSGKTTAISCMLSLLEFNKGKIEIFGKEMTPTAYDIKRQIGVVFQNVAVFDELTVYENIDYFCGLYVYDKKERKKLVDEAIEFVGLGDFIKFRPKKLSGGLLRRLNIACGIAHKPKLIIFDEPTVAVDPQSRNNILEGIKRLNSEGATIIYTSHYMEEVEQICSRIAILDKGRVIAQGTKEELKDMISKGEKISVQVYGISEEQLAKMLKIPGVAGADFADGTISISMNGKSGGIAQIIEFLNENNIGYGRISSELPTLNDVFLELTGKTFRD